MCWCRKRHASRAGYPKEQWLGHFLPNAVDVLTLLFADDVKMVAARSPIGILQNSLTNVWEWSENWDPTLSLQLYRSSSQRQPVPILCRSQTLLKAWSSRSFLPSLSWSDIFQLPFASQLNRPSHTLVKRRTLYKWSFLRAFQGCFKWEEFPIIMAGCCRH